MIIKIKVGDKTSHSLLPDISYDKFTEYMFDSGSSDVEYNKYLGDNNMVELTDFNSQTTDEIVLIVEDSFMGRVLKFKCVYDSDNDVSFNENEYFDNNKINL